MENNQTEKTEPKKDETSWKESPFLIIKGFLMGSADIVPGVSGGTMALITGIYDRLIFAIQSADLQAAKSALTFQFKKLFEHFHWKFFLLLFTGIFSAVIFFTRIVPLQVYMFTHPEIVYGLFFGLIVGSIVLLMSEVEKTERTPVNFLYVLVGAFIGFWVVTLVPADTPESFGFVFLSGSIAICAMILPGISGSYLLLIFRKYDYILSLLGMIGTMDTVDAILNLIPFFLGALFGIILFSRILSWLLKNFHTATLMVLIGFLIGSLYVIWPYQQRTFEDHVRDREIVEMTDPIVEELQQRESIPPGPQYQRIGEIQNPDASFDRLKRVEIETVSRKLVSSQPFFPGINWPEQDQGINKIGGIAGMGIGLFLIIGIAWLRRKQ
ncbi:DUF368 domain-containing protein [Rhodohalobacter sp. 614A]|uniref:DUF368 domain-containing protein n=1 Tax=Rhodohalobacter sp. 614A TaxID=2908649 RepID=UPI001F176AB9|nr:DUF368 domain-containing protein [Rhodohalobacter sp. 614A]